MRLKFGVLLAIVACLVFYAGLCLPPLLYTDDDAGLTHTGAAMLKVRATQSAKLPAVVHQITDVVNPSAFPKRSDEDGYMNGAIVWRAPFGIAFGRSEIRGDDVATQEFDGGPFLVGWFLFFVSEAALIGLAIFCLSPQIRKGWAPVEKWEEKHRF
jgi:hypothetical protein